MTGATDSDAAGDENWTRRGVLVGGATALAVLCVGPAAAAQGMTTGVIPTPGRWPDENLAGFEIRVDDGDATGTAEGDATAETGVDTTVGTTEGNATAQTETDAATGTTEDDVPECEFGDWPPQEVASHEVLLVNRKDEDAPEEETTLRTSAEVDVEANAPYLINRFERCETDYVGVELESVEGGAVEAEDDPEEVEDDPNEPADAGENDTPAQGPGFGVVAAAAAALGVGGWLARRDSE